MRCGRPPGMATPWAPDREISQARLCPRAKSFGASWQVWAAESFLHALGAGGADALVDRECLPQRCDGLAGVAFLQVAVADSRQGACFLWGRADVAGDGQRPAVLVAGLGYGRGAEREF